MGRLIKNTAILAKIETVPGTDPVPTGAANAILVSNLSINPLNAQNVDRELVRAYLGGSEQLVGTAFVQMGFDVEFAGSSAAGTAPPWGPLIRACAMAEALLTTPSRVEYSPISASMESVTIYWYDDGSLHKATYSRGTVEFKLGLGNRPVMSFKFFGLYSAVTAAALPTTTLTTWQKPLVITDANSGDITFGSTLTTGTLSGGVSYPSRGIDSLDLGNSVNHTPLLGGESVEITAREIKGSFQLDLTAAQEVTQMASVVANTTQPVSFQHGNVAGNILIMHMPSAQLINPSKQEFNGKRLIGYDYRAVPVSGNDELKICIK